MAGKIVADTLEHSTAGSLTTDYVVNGSAKVWVNFNGQNTIATRDSLNVSSLTDNAVGDYSTNFSTNMANVNYITLGGVMNEDAHSRGPFALGVKIDGGGVPVTHSTSAERYEYLYGANASSDGGTQDTNACYAMVMGDLA